MVYSDHLELFVIFMITKSYNLPCICCYPSCVEVIVEVVVGCVVIPLNVEVIEVECWLRAYPSIERLILCGLVPCLLCRGCCCLREEFVSPKAHHSTFDDD